ncbi:MULTISPECIES: dienelactone hydrolase [unclassified Variovorax]|jgi:predicted dienelactone hydrolase|uniref:alpha/beta hydrolase family protein n=1 Tax=unclassified Variovorax TaxID=663243 RepID=UPI000F7E75A7|nr:MULTISPECIES: dienelactone hydrolase [unclassified Variovorax]RSZ37068.1 dienelactone hydrolase [Variovorax sp. 553]RSZ37881.1 dienelactone hydrolase [Variovorax sp. 679]
MSLLRTLCLAAACLTATLAHAAGFSTIEIPADREGPAMQGAVWTPCAAPAGEIRLGRTTIQGVRDCPLPPGAHLPLIVISHGYGGSFLGHHDTAQALADAGFIVAAISHSEDNFQIRGGPNDRISALATRTTDIKRLIDHMLQQWPAHDRIAADQIGFHGFSRGGYTGLVLAGARPDFERLPPLPSSPCARAPESAECGWMKQRFRDLLATPLTHDTRIKAAVIADPLSMLFDAQGLKNVTIPIELWASAYGGDGVTPENVAAVRRNLPVAPEWHVAEKSEHFGFLAPCSQAQIEAKVEICRDAPGFDRTAFHKAFNTEVAAFFNRHLAPKP